MKPTDIVYPVRITLGPFINDIEQADVVDANSRIVCSDEVEIAKLICDGLNFYNENYSSKYEIAKKPKPTELLRDQKIWLDAFNSYTLANAGGTATDYHATNWADACLNRFKERFAQ